MISLESHKAATKLYADRNIVKRVAEWLRRWSGYLGVWGSIPGASVMNKKPWVSFESPLPLSPSSNGYLVHTSKVGSTVADAFPVNEENIVR